MNLNVNLVMSYPIQEIIKQLTRIADALEQRNRRADEAERRLFEDMKDFDTKLENYEESI